MEEHGEQQSAGGAGAIWRQAIWQNLGVALTASKRRMHV